MKVPIEAIPTPAIWQESGVTAVLRIEALKGFTTSDGQFIQPSRNGSDDFYLEIPITINNGQAVIAGFELDSTEDAYPWDAETTGDVPGYRATIVTSRGKKIPFFPQFKVPTLTPGDPSLTWGEIRVFNRSFRQRYTGLDRFISVTQVLEWIQNAVGALNRSSSTNTGVTALTTDPVDPVFPIAVAVNDPHWQTFLAGDFGMTGTLGTIDNRVPRSDGTDGRTLQSSLVAITDEGNVGIGTDTPIFNDDGTTGANVGRWLAVDGGNTEGAAYFGVGGSIPSSNARVGALNFYNLAMGGADHRTAHIMSANDGALGRGNLIFSTSPNNVGPVQRMQINYNGDVGINHDAGVGVRLQIMGQTADASSYTLVLLKAGDTPYLFARNDGKVMVGTTDPNGIVAPVSSNVFFVGTSGQFSVSALGDSLQRSLQLTGDVRPAADATNRGMIWFVPGGPGVADTIEVCVKAADDTYSWRTLI